MRKLFKFLLHKRKLDAIFKILQVQKRIVSAETICGNTVLNIDTPQPKSCYSAHTTVENTCVLEMNRD